MTRQEQRYTERRKRKFARQVAALIIGTTLASSFFGCIIVKLDYVMKTQADMMDQVMWTRQELDSVKEDVKAIPRFDLLSDVTQTHY